MKILYSWLKDFIDIDLTASELEKHLTSLGMEVEEITKIGADFDDIYAAKIVKIHPHPNADKLHLVDLETKDGTLRVVCGAKNIEEGQIVPLAKVGARLGKEYLKPAVIRGVASEGMLCSSKELGLTADASGIMLLDKNTPIGTNIKELYGKPDIIFDLELTPNRPDLMSHLGVARELSVLLNIPLKNKEIKHIEGNGNSLEVNILTDETGCQRYNGRIIKNVKNCPSPKWLAERLSAMGVNPKNAIVDITNYVLYEIGHPLHAFDLNHLKEGKINVRWATEGEEFLGLDGVKRTLSEQNLVIADGQKPVALAGVIGGENDSILPETKDIFLEAAYFYPPCINKTSKKMAISTESSQRFERGVDIENCTRAMDIATQLIVEICGGEVSKVNDVYPQPYTPNTVTFTPKDIEKILGMEIEEQKLKDIFGRLGKLEISGEKWLFTPPTHRRDLNHKWDLAEEAARFIGFDKLAEKADSSYTHLYFAENPKNIDIENILIEKLIGQGFLECKNYDFVSQKEIETFGFDIKNCLEIQNPLAQGMEFLRPTLLMSLLKNIHHNQNFSRDNLRLFESGKTFSLQKGYPVENFAISGVLTGKTPTQKFFLSPQCHYGIFGLKGIIETLLCDYEIKLVPTVKAPVYMHPKICMDIMLDNKVIGILGQVHPLTLKAFDVKNDVWAFEFNLKNLEKHFDTQTFKKAKDVSNLPSSERDLSFILDKTIPYAKIQQVLNPLEVKYNLIDLYQGENLAEGKKSMTLHFEFTAKEKTLTDKEVNTAVENILNKLKEQLGAELR